MFYLEASYDRLKMTDRTLIMRLRLTIITAYILNLKMLLNSITIGILQCGRPGQVPTLTACFTWTGWVTFPASLAPLSLLTLTVVLNAKLNVKVLYNSPISGYRY